MADSIRHSHRPTVALTTLKQRAALLETVRQFFQQRGYLEVETPLLSGDVCIDAWLDPFILREKPSAGAPEEPMFLQTSPEFAMKRLLAAGCNAIYQVTRSFRKGEIGPLHNPEFTIVEWYRVGDEITQQMSLVEELVRATLETAAGLERRERAGLLPERIPRLTYDEAFSRFAGEPVLRASCRQLRNLARRKGVAAPAGLATDDRDGWLNLLLTALVEPKLSELPAVFLTDYPATQAALARVREGDPPVAERFELYLRGIEICNGYQELTDPVELKNRMLRQADLRRAAGASKLPVDSRLLAAMQEGLPECAGVALGFDRLVMWCLNAHHIRDVIAFPFDRA
ncbi:MAG: EF-P lysine aminoacylase GenX [Planctomycetota bacterium]|nr:MAG: EF-P lysine aminoacylase GenX [Planctomycetota bacterium]REK24751.1 MAG: EF-P lysine aminoacylase GenX [Planctomycetota bacterium]REK37811.1 MAG: EF-P lysine aminoacylase GenX [Planctomycetota bacterium]